MLNVRKHWLVVVAGLVIAVFVGLVYLVRAHGFDRFWFWTVPASLLTAVLASALVGIIYDVFFRRRQIDDTVRLTRYSVSLFNAGIEEYVLSFRQQGFGELITKSEHVDVCFVYGSTWLQTNMEHLRALFANPRATVRFFLADPSNTTYMKVLEQSWRSPADASYTAADIRKRITRSLSEIANEIQSAAATVECHVISAPITFSFYRFDDELLYVPMKLCRDKHYPVPALRCRRSGGDCLYGWVMGQINELVNEGSTRLVAPGIPT
jgi:hypothetical protein